MHTSFDYRSHSLRLILTWKSGKCAARCQKNSICSIYAIAFEESKLMHRSDVGQGSSHRWRSSRRERKVKWKTLPFCRNVCSPSVDDISPWRIGIPVSISHGKRGCERYVLHTNKWKSFVHLEFTSGFLFFLFFLSNEHLKLLND